MRVCEICKKGTIIQKSGAHQYGGGWAMRAPKKRAVWQVNLHKVRVTYLPAGRQDQGVKRTMRLCTKCLRKVRGSVSEKYKKAKPSEDLVSVLGTPQIPSV